MNFLNTTINAKQAEAVAAAADKELKEQSTCLYGRYEGGEWHSLSSYQKPGDTHKMLGYMGAYISLSKTISEN